MSFGGAPVISSSTLGWNAYIPALIRSETGWFGLLREADDPAGRRRVSTTPPADGFGASGRPSGWRVAVPAMRVDQ